MTDFSLCFTLPFPDALLSPNCRKKWAKIEAVTIARAHGHAILFDNAAAILTVPPELRLCLEFHPPDNRHRDLDNLIASMKPYVDGVFDALRTNDHCIKEIEARLSTVRKDGLVIVTLEALK